MRTVVVLILMLWLSKGTVAQIYASDKEVCNGDSIFLSGYPLGGEWTLLNGDDSVSIQGNNFNYNFPGLYHVKYTIDSLCDTASILIVEYIDIVVKDTTLCVGDTLVFSNLNDNSKIAFYEWWGDSVSVGGHFFSVTEVGTYNVYGVTGPACGLTHTFNVTHGDSCYLINTDNLLLESSLMTFVNNNGVVIVRGLSVDYKQIYIANLLGEVIYSAAEQSESHSFSMLRSGVFVCTVVTENYSYSKKFLVE
jgi:hypothetical protein